MNPFTFAQPESLEPAQVKFAERLVQGTGRVLESLERRAAISRRQTTGDLTDPLTGCASLDALDRRLTEEFERARPHGLPFSLGPPDVEGPGVAAGGFSGVVPDFQGDGGWARATSNEKGEFVLDAKHRNDARLVVEAPEHSKLEQALPLPGVLRIALVTRRRTLLERLVRWAQRTGAPFDAQPEPTPGHVRRAAFRAQDEEIEDWARGVESAVYGPTMVDEQLETQLVAGEPRGGRKLGV